MNELSQKIVSTLYSAYDRGELGGNSSNNCAVTVLLGSSEWCEHYCAPLQKFYDPTDTNVGKLKKKSLEQLGMSFEDLMSLEYVFEDRFPLPLGNKGCIIHKSRNLESEDDFNVLDAILRVEQYLMSIDSSPVLKLEKSFQ